MKICAFIQMYNESIKGNLTRCLENVRQWADDIVIYDDASTDNSVEIASQYTSNIILGRENNINSEQSHKQELLGLALTLSPDWLMWIDCDEILDRESTTGKLRDLAHKADTSVDAYTFHEVNLWRSETYARLDTSFDAGDFCRLWRVVPGMSFNVVKGVHRPPHPSCITNKVTSGLKVIHYGFAKYEEAVVKQGFGYCTDSQFQKAAKCSWIFNETTCKCYKVPLDLFPIENVPEDLWPEPKPLRIDELRSVKEGYELWKQYASEIK